MGIFSLIALFILAVCAYMPAVRFTHTIILFAPFFLIFTFSLGYGQDLKVQRAKPMMGTIVEITVIRDDSSPSRIPEEEIIGLAFQEISRIDKLMSTYKENSQISLINQQAGIDYVTVEPDVLKVIKMAKAASMLSGGAFDITAAPLVQLWGFHTKKGHMPPEEEIKNCLPLVDYKYILVDQENNRVKLKLPGMAMDLGGIAKGYAVDKAIEILKNNGIHRALVNAGGDLYGLGYPPAKNFWHIGIRHPFIPGGIISTLKIKDQAIATSGNYENFFELNGKRYSHILDPRTGQPIQGVASVTVLAKTAMEADAFGTAVAVLGPQKGLELLNSRPDIEGIIILDDPKKPDYLLSQGLEGKLSFAF
jgi:thiamine biosynthesis lipoprotein